MVLRLIARSPRGPGFLAPVVGNVRHAANLASASGGQDHTPSPSALASLVRRNQSVHRIPASRSVTIGHNALCIEAGCAGADHIILKNGIGIFFAKGIDTRISVESLNEFRFSARAILRLESPASGRHRQNRTDLPDTARKPASVAQMSDLSSVRMIERWALDLPQGCDIARLVFCRDEK